MTDLTMANKIKDFYYRYGNGLYGYIKDYLGAEWFTDDLAKTLNFIYFKNRSGEKTASPFLNELMSSKVLSTDGYMILDVSLGDEPTLLLDNLARCIVDKYGEKWKDTFNALTLKYDLMNYYSEDETNTPDVTMTFTGKHNAKTKNTSSVTSNTTMYGFDSGTSGVKSNTIDSNGNSETSEGEDDNNYLNTSKEEGTRKRTFTKKGGEIVERVKKYIELRKTNIIDIIMTDIDNLITIPIYCID